MLQTNFHHMEMSWSSENLMIPGYAKWPDGLIRSQLLSFMMYTISYLYNDYIADEEKQWVLRLTIHCLRA